MPFNSKSIKKRKKRSKGNHSVFLNFSSCSLKTILSFHDQKKASPPAALAVVGMVLALSKIAEFSNMAPLIHS